MPEVVLSLSDFGSRLPGQTGLGTLQGLNLGSCVFGKHQGMQGNAPECPYTGQSHPAPCERNWDLWRALNDSRASVRVSTTYTNSAHVGLGSAAACNRAEVIPPRPQRRHSATRVSAAGLDARTRYNPT